MWRLWHRLFGYHYVLVDRSVETRVRQVEYTPLGRPYFRAYWDLWVFLDEVQPRYEWTPLTFEKRAAPKPQKVAA